MQTDLLIDVQFTENHAINKLVINRIKQVKKETVARNASTVSFYYAIRLSIA
ncbi:hypothetical protein [Sporosarcina sp. OR05]|uniref:hypothetical protein n=1 Tax=Sporosarcina sp. OR05 TaxID=2969819 RepID=UPI003529E35C